MTADFTEAKNYLFEGVCINPLIVEYVKIGYLTYPTISQVFGPAPAIPDSPDTDARLEAWEDQVEYSTKIQRAEDYIKDIIKKCS